MTAAEIRLWLMAQPRPSSIRVTTAEGDQHSIPCGRVGWKKISLTIEALEWVLLEAMDPNDQLLRATRNGAVEDDPETASAAAPAVVALPPNADPESQRFHLFATLLAGAYRHSTDVAFERLGDMIESLADKASEGDRARETFYRAQIKQLEGQIRALGSEPQGTGDFLGQILQNFVGGQAAAAQNGKSAPSNGAQED